MFHKTIILTPSWQFLLYPHAICYKIYFLNNLPHTQKMYLLLSHELWRMHESRVLLAFLLIDVKINISPRTAAVTASGPHTQGQGPHWDSLFVSLLSRSKARQGLSRACMKTLSLASKPVFDEPRCLFSALHPKSPKPCLF